MPTPTTYPNDKAIPWFNPREMDDATLVALATGREALLNEFLLTVERRRQGISDGHTGEHWLVTGTRGAGKSYFLRYAQIRTGQSFAPNEVRFVLLPEELRNLRAPHNLLDEINRMLSVADGNLGQSAQWRNEDIEALWRTALHNLMARLDSLPSQLLVVGIENFADVLERAFKDDVAASLLRQLMEHEPRILFLTSAVDGSFDEQYRQRLFLQFSQHPLQAWDAQAHRAYLTERAKLIGKEPTARQLARIDAYSRYTGGNARIAGILAAAILDETDITRVSADLNATLDKMSDYYRALLDAMPSNTEALFDALVRGGEPCSQTQLAERVGARQNDISRAFHWLLEGNYLLAKRATGQKEILYQVADRLFVQWYRMRYINPGQLSRLAVLAELLADTLAFGEKWSFAQQLAQQGQPNDAQLMAELGFKDCRIDMNKLKTDGTSLETLLQWGDRLAQMPVAYETSPLQNKDGDLHALRMLDLLEKFPTEALMQEEFDLALMFANNCGGFSGMVSGQELAELCLGSLGFFTVDKLDIIRQIPRLTPDQWQGLTQVFQYELIKFNKRMPTEGEKIKELRKVSETGLKYSWIMSWYLFSQGFFFNEEYSPLDKKFIAALSGGIYCLYESSRSIDALTTYTEKAWRNLSQSLSDLIRQGMAPCVLDFLQPLIEAGKDHFAREQLALLCNHGSTAASFSGKPQQHLALAQQAVACFDAPSGKSNQPDSRAEQAYALGRLGWAWGEESNWPQALAYQQKAIALLPPTHDKASWHIGQAARHLWHLEGFEAAWAFIEAQPWQDTSAPVAAIRQLGDRVVDEQRQAGAAQAYAIARPLLARVLRQTLCPPVTAVRALFIDMLSEDLSLDTLSDLAQDLAQGRMQDEDQALSGRTGGPDKDIVALAQTLVAWIADLQTRQHTTPPVTTRPPPHSPADPDWQITLEALNKALPIYTRIRLGLEPTPQLGANASRVFQRMMGFVHRHMAQPAISAPERG